MNRILHKKSMKQCRVDSLHFRSPIFVYEIHSHQNLPVSQYLGTQLDMLFEIAS